MSKKRTSLDSAIEEEIFYINEFHEDFHRDTKSVSNEWNDFVAEYKETPSIDEMFHLKRQLRKDVEYFQGRLEYFESLENNFAKLYHERNKQNKNK